MVRYDENDVPNKYGETKKMQEIWELIYENKPLSEASFSPSKEDKEYYEIHKKDVELMRSLKGPDFRYEHFINDIDP